PAVGRHNAARHLMGSANHADISVDAVHCGDVTVAAQGATGQIKTATDRVHNGPGDFGGAVDLDAGTAPIEKLAWLHVVITIGGAVDRQTKRLNHVGADQIG